MFAHYKRETVRKVLLLYFHLEAYHLLHQTERRNYSLRDQLKAQYRATQKAQVNERKASDSKRRLTSYVFHEVRGSPPALLHGEHIKY